jgi:hypothetical protein
VAETDPLPALRAEAAALGLPLVPISAVTGFGVTDAKRAILALVHATRDAAVAHVERA